MIFEYNFTKPSKAYKNSRQFYISETAIKSGLYRELFSKSFFSYGEAYEVCECYNGLIVRLPGNCVIECELPLVTLEGRPSMWSMKKIIEKGEEVNGKEV